MQITTSVTVPDYVYQFYAKVSAHLQQGSNEEMMSIALEQYAGMISLEIMKDKESEDEPDN